MIWILLAQVEPLAGSGVSGWAGAGILGLVLSWLLFVHLPSKDKQLKDLIDTYNTRADTVMDKFTTSLTNAETEFNSALKLVVEHCEKENEKFASRLGK